MLNLNLKRVLPYAFLVLIAVACSTSENDKKGPDSRQLAISENKRFLAVGDNKPFFWLGDTGWLLFGRLTREEAEKYLENRKQKGFNVVQVMVLHTLGAANVYGDSALVGKNIATPKLTEGSSFSDSTQYDFWDHVDFVIDKAAEKGIYMALVPLWGNNVKSKRVNQERAKAYAEFIANRYKNRPNIIWLDGGDIKGSDSLDVWKTIGRTINQIDSTHLITFHPRGRASSSEWFHNEPWLDFNMVQSGHKSYAQDTSAKDRWHYGEDNWRYMQADLVLKPTKPVIDGEPSYEQIPYGLHNPKDPRWTADDVRRYGYWSVLAGAFGYTYGHNSIMQFYKKGDKKSSFGAIDDWTKALDAPGAGQMIHLKNLMLAHSFFDRVPGQSLIANQGSKYDYLVASRGPDYALVYTYTGRNIKLNMGKLPGDAVAASWFSPRDGKTTAIGDVANKSVQEFNPPAEPKNGNDWVLVIEKK
ncbi:glycoside hydrolase family 140 protein [Spirosoma validum]|uniref:Glycoside hydrolase family 140 protein n=1 Tax=Spirosoma validum TaxID=2771355 RepID=A0A927GDY5_9BACT|nr:glycoside hydrolase family 140 protein [Spirosoma validum]MBD2754148.1 glycoside hydrolase family 140 protein [Spirosoma validum]